MLNQAYSYKAAKSGAKKQISGVNREIQNLVTSRFSDDWFVAASDKIYAALRKVASQKGTKKDYTPVLNLIRNKKTRDGEKMSTDEANAFAKQLVDLMIKRDHFEQGESLADEAKKDIRSRLHKFGFIDDSWSIIDGKKQRDVDIDKVIQLFESEKKYRVKNEIWDTSEGIQATGDLADSVPKLIDPLNDISKFLEELTGFIREGRTDLINGGEARYIHDTDGNRITYKDHDGNDVYAEHNLSRAFNAKIDKKDKQRVIGRMKAQYDLDQNTVKANMKKIKMYGKVKDWFGVNGAGSGGVGFTDDEFKALETAGVSLEVPFVKETIAVFHSLRAKNVDFDTDCLIYVCQSKDTKLRNRAYKYGVAVKEIDRERARYLGDLRSGGYSNINI